MRRTPYDVNSIKARLYKLGRNQAFVKEFAEGEDDCVKVEDWAHKTAVSCANALNTAAESLGLTQIKAIVRNKEVYLYKIWAIKE